MLGEREMKENTLQSMSSVRYVTSSQKLPANLLLILLQTQCRYRCSYLHEVSNKFYKDSCARGTVKHCVMCHVCDFFPYLAIWARRAQMARLF